MRSTSAEFAGQARRLLRSFPPASGDGQSPDVTFSVIVAPAPKSPSIRPFHFVYLDNSLLGRTTNYWQLFRFVEGQLDIFLAKETEGSYLLHAGAVARNGAGIILPGASGSGKSSLTMALLDRGYRYLSDELAVVDPITGELRAFPKPLGIKDISLFPNLVKRNDLWVGPETVEPGEDESVWYVHPEDLTPESIGCPIPIRYIIFPKYVPGAAPQLQRLAPSLAMRQLLENSVNFPQFGGDGVRLMARLVEDAQCFSLTTNGLEATTTLINKLTE